MKIGYWVPNKYVTSVKIYTEEVMKELKGNGFSFIPFGSKDSLPKDVDLYWDSTCTGGKHPNKRLLNAKKPAIVTVHGAAPMSLPLAYTYNGRKNQVKGWFQNQKKKVGWHTVGHKVDHIITVSEYAREEILKYLPIGKKNVHVIYHGFDRSKFSPMKLQEWKVQPDPFYFHISVYQPKKNIEAILEAYYGIPFDKRQPLVLYCPGYPRRIEEGGIRLENTFIEHREMSALLRRAHGFIFPSLHESFGLPILEAMASGCPVLTSDSTSCREIGGDAALLVDPTDVESIRAGMIRLFNDEELRLELRESGLNRSKDFAWSTSAKQHALVFERAASNLKVVK